MRPLPLLLFSTTLILLPFISLSSPHETYIVLTQPTLKPTHFRTHHHWYSSTLNSLIIPTTQLMLQHQSQSQSQSHPPTLLHTYTTTLNGFAARLTPPQLSSLLSLPFVLSVLPDRAHRLHTTRSPQFLGLGPASDSKLIAESGGGEGVVIAVLDSGIDPSHPSFRDEGLGLQGEVPARWKGKCEVGDKFPAGSCNRKLIGASFFPAGFKAAASATNITTTTTTDIMSPYDTDGHGTHTASTAAGRPSQNASLFSTFATGTASGISPNARIAVYKVCWSSGCFDSDILAAIDAAVADGADILSLSVGAAPTPYHLDPIAIAAFAASVAGVLVSASAGNDGPGEMTATNISPWMVTVGAGSIDRDFPSDIILGNGDVITGASLYAGPMDDRYFPLAYAGDLSTPRVGFRSSAPFCMRGSLDPEAARGRVVLCERGAVPRAEKGWAVKEVGGAGVIVANHLIDGEGLVPDAYLIPGVGIGAMDGFRVHAYLANEKEPRVLFDFRGTRLGVRPAPVVASFSGRGPSVESAYIIKPDVIAPGVGILAAWTDSASPTRLIQDTRRTKFNILSGTSMACPHVSGIAALLKAAHSDWSPAAVKSAMMTSASTMDNLGHDITDDSSGNRSAGWAMGSGYVNPEKAVDPGLLYDISTEEYIRFLCSSNYSPKDICTIARRPVKCPWKSTVASWDLNYPSISVVLQQSNATTELEVTVPRMATNAGEYATEYNVSIQNPIGTTVTIRPSKLAFLKKGEKLGFLVKIAALNMVGLKRGSSKTEFGSMAWTDGKHVVRSPIAVTWQQKW